MRLLREKYEREAFSEAASMAEGAGQRVRERKERMKVERRKKLRRAWEGVRE